MISRRGILGLILAAPAIIRKPGLLMPVKVVQRGWQIPGYMTYSSGVWAADWRDLPVRDSATSRHLTPHG